MTNADLRNAKRAWSLAAFDAMDEGRRIESARGRMCRFWISEQGREAARRLAAKCAARQAAA